MKLHALKLVKWPTETWNDCLAKNMPFEEVIFTNIIGLLVKIWKFS